MVSLSITVLWSLIWFRVYIHAVLNAQLDVESGNDCDFVSFSEGLIALYRFHSPGHGIVYDSSGNGNSGSVKSPLSSDQGSHKITFSDEYPACGVTHGFKFNYSYIEIPSSDSLNFNPSVAFSISLWVYHDVEAGDDMMSSESIGLVQKSKTDLTQYGIGMGKYYPEAGTGHGFSNGNVEGNGGVPLDRGAWYHLAAVKVSPSEVICFYVNGNKVCNGRGWRRSGGTSSSSMPLLMGVNDPANPWGYPGYFQGILASVQIYNRALTESEILQLADRCIECDECVSENSTSSLCACDNVFCVGNGQEYILLQDAIDAVQAAGSTILISGGTYWIEGITIGSSTVNGNVSHPNEIKPMDNHTVIIRKSLGTIVERGAGENHMVLIDGREFWNIHSGNGTLIFEGHTSEHVNRNLGRCITIQGGRYNTIGPLFILSNGEISGISLSPNNVIDGVYFRNEKKQIRNTEVFEPQKMFNVFQVSTGCRIRNCVLIGVEAFGIYFDMSNDVAIENCSFSLAENARYWSNTAAIKTSRTCNNILISDNVFTNHVLVSGHSHIWADGTISDITIRHNLFSCLSSENCVIFQQGQISGAVLEDSCYFESSSNVTRKIRDLDNSDLVNGFTCVDAIQIFINGSDNAGCLSCPNFSQNFADVQRFVNESSFECDLETGMTHKCNISCNDDTEADTKIDTEADTTGDTEADTEIDTEADTTGNTEADTEIDTEADTTGDTEADTEIDTDADTTGDTEADTVESNSIDTEIRDEENSIILVQIFVPIGIVVFVIGVLFVSLILVLLVRKTRKKRHAEEMDRKKEEEPRENESTPKDIVGGELQPKLYSPSAIDDSPIYVNEVCADFNPTKITIPHKIDEVADEILDDKSLKESDDESDDEQTLDTESDDESEDDQTFDTESDDESEENT